MAVESLFVQVTVSPSVIVIDFGEKPDAKMFTDLVAAPAGPATASAANTVITPISLRMVVSCRVGDRTFHIVAHRQPPRYRLRACFTPVEHALTER